MIWNGRYSKWNASHEVEKLMLCWSSIVFFLLQIAFTKINWNKKKDERKTENCSKHQQNWSIKLDGQQNINKNEYYMFWANNKLNFEHKEWTKFTICACCLVSPFLGHHHYKTHSCQFNGTTIENSINITIVFLLKWRELSKLHE